MKFNYSVYEFIYAVKQMGNLCSCKKNIIDNVIKNGKIPIDADYEDMIIILRNIDILIENLNIHLRVFISLSLWIRKRDEELLKLKKYLTMHEIIYISDTLYTKTGIPILKKHLSHNTDDNFDFLPTPNEFRIRADV